MKRILKNNNGSSLMLVILVTVVLSILMLALSGTSIANSLSLESSINSDKAYLAARSAYEIMKSMASESDTAAKIRRSRDLDPITMDLDDLGSAKVKVYKVYTQVQAVNSLTGVPAVDSEGNPVYEDVLDDSRVKIESTGTCGNSSYTLTRYMSVTAGSDASSLISSEAYQQYGNLGSASDPTVINGNIEGNIIIHGDGYLQITNATEYSNPMHKVVSVGNLDLSDGGGSSTDNCFELIATGGHLTLPSGGTIVKTDVLVGLKDNLTDSDPSNDPYFIGTNCEIRGNLKCEGDITLGNSTIGVAPDTGTDTYMSEVVMFSGGSISIGSSGGGTTNIYGSIVCNGDFTANETVTIYGDIICNGNVSISYTTKVNGTIYAAGNVDISTSNSSFSSRAAYAGGTITTSGSASYTGSQYPNLITDTTTTPPTFVSGDSGNALKEKIVYYFYSDIDFVSADEYITDELTSSPIPVITFPSKFDSMTPKQFYTTTCTGGCGIAEYNEHIAHHKTETCWSWWSDYHTDAERYSGEVHVAHQVETSEYCTGCNDEAYNIHTEHTVAAVPSSITISSDCVIDENIQLGVSLDADYSTTSILYIDASKNDVDILMKSGSSITSTNGAKIYINDGAGQYKVRLFMEDGASINLNTWSVYGILPISDDYPDLTVDEIADYSQVDAEKIPQFYIFSEFDENAARAKVDGDDSYDYPEVDVTLNPGYIPGYIVAPSLELIAPAAGCRYNELQDDLTLTSSTCKVPFVYGVLICDQMDFAGSTRTWIKYDDRLSEASSETSLKFAAATADIVSYLDD